MDDNTPANAYERLRTLLENPLAEKTSTFRDYSVAEIISALENSPIQLMERGRTYAYVISPAHYDLIMRLLCRKIDLEKHYEEGTSLINANLLQDLIAVAPEKTAHLFSTFFGHDDLKDQTAGYMSILKQIADSPETSDPEVLAAKQFYSIMEPIIHSRKYLAADLLDALAGDIQKMAEMCQENPEKASGLFAHLEAIMSATDRDSSQKGDEDERRTNPDEPDKGTDS